LYPLSREAAAASAPLNFAVTASRFVRTVIKLLSSKQLPEKRDIFWAARIKVSEEIVG
jgi:hypothetical protein